LSSQSFNYLISIATVRLQLWRSGWSGFETLNANRGCVFVRSHEMIRERLRVDKDCDPAWRMAASMQQVGVAHED